MVVYIVMDATLNLDSQLTFWTIEVQNVRPNSVLTAKLHAKSKALSDIDIRAEVLSDGTRQ